MKQLFLMVNDGSIKLIDTPAPTVKDGTVIVETEYSVVSAGTERGPAGFGGKNLIQKALERPDQVKKVTEKMSTDGILTTVEGTFTRLKEPMPMGYSAVGTVVECGNNVKDLRPGDRVTMVGQAYHSEVNRVNHNLIAKIPADVEDLRPYSLSALGGIALEGIHQAEIIPGETVAVIGLGLLGHITSRILDAYGCDVIGFDVAEKSLAGTRLKAFIKSDDDNAVGLVKSLTSGYGVDKVIITAATNSNAPMDLAAAITRDRAIICMIGVTHMNIERRPYYEKELTFKIARSYGAGRYDSSYEEDGVDYPIGYVRFTEGRNIQEFVRLVHGKRVNFSDLITHVIPFEKASEAYSMITDNPKHEKYIGVLLEYKKYPEKFESIISHKKNRKVTKKDTIGFGLIGAGNFAKNTLLPIMKENGGYRFVGLATTGGPGAAEAESSFGFEYTTNNYKKMLEDETIDLIGISTQHSSHAKFVKEILKAGKSVYCEKPLCLTLSELDEIEKIYWESDGELFCGLNRRHAPLVKMIKKELNTGSIPAVYDYIANAGFIPNDHWTQNDKKGGGRLIGEAIHFIDTIQYLASSPIKKLSVTYGSNNAFPKGDNAIISLSFESGAIANIIYSSMGSKKYPKEQLRVLSCGAVYVLDNYIRMEKYGNSKNLNLKLRQDKGFKAEYQYIRDVLVGKQKNEYISEVFEGHRRLLEALQSVQR